MKRIICYYIIISLSCIIGLLAGCTSSEEDLYGSFSGIVTDADTKEPLKGVSVSITPQGETKVTGSDGTYTFQGLEPTEYTISYKREGYETDTKKTKIEAGVNNKVDMVLVPLRPKLMVSTETLDFGNENTTLTLDISNTGKGVLQWEITEDIEWLECKPLTGKTEKEVSSVVVNVTREGWVKGDYSRTFAIASNGGSATITVKMSVSGCNLKVSPEEVDLGETESTAQLTLTNKGNGSVDYKVEASNEWIGLSKTSGKVSDTDYIILTVNRGSLAAGDYNSLVTFKVEEENIVVPVKLTISAKSRPVVSLDAVKNIAYNGATLNGTVVSVGNTKITRYGFCWAQHTEPTINDAFSNMGDCSVPMSFNGTITDLTANTKYYVRAYAENNEGISYSNEETFTTAGVPVVPSVQTNEVTNIKSTTASANGFLSSLGNVTLVSQHGHIWSTSDKLDISLPTKTELGKLEAPVAFNSEITGLKPNQKYYICAYATNEKGTAYGEVAQFTTLAADMVLTTNEVTNIIHNAATCGGVITDYGGRTVKECGVCWSMKEDAVSINDNKVTGKPENGKWSCRLEGLEKETDYYARAYVQSSDDAVFYGKVHKFTTTQEIKLPSIARITITGIDTQGAILQSSITDSGNSEITTCGFCWSTSPNPTTENENVACDAANNSFGTKLSGLKDGTKYYVRAYAVNAMGTGYSEQAEFSTTEITIPVWGTASVSNIGRTRVNVSATLTSNGNAEVTEMGVCWATHPESSVYDEKQVCQNGNAITTQVTGLKGTTTYYLRVYAQNAKGIAYSNEVSFTTTDSEVDVWDGISVDTKFAGGSGTENDPILIESAAQLKLLADKVNSGTTYAGVYFKLISGINLNEKMWTPIENFGGNFNGNGNKIEGLKANSRVAGLFGTISGATLTNLHLQGQVKGYTAGLLVGKGYGTINHITTEGKVDSESDNGGYLGGVCGELNYNSSSITNCTNKCNVIGNNYYCGGIVGRIFAGQSQKTFIINNVNMGTISSASHSGGIIGYGTEHNYGSLNVINNVNYATAKADKYAGGIIGYSYYITNNHNYWLNDIVQNIGNEKGYGNENKEETDSYFTRNSVSCSLFQLNNKDLVDTLNEWVNDNDPTLYRKWVYKKDSEGKAYPAME